MARARSEFSCYWVNVDLVNATGDDAGDDFAVGSAGGWRPRQASAMEVHACVAGDLRHLGFVGLPLNTMTEHPPNRGPSNHPLSSFEPARGHHRFRKDRPGAHGWWIVLVVVFGGLLVRLWLLWQ